MESDESCKCAARPNGLLNKTQLRCRTLSREHRRAIRCRTQGALGMLRVIYKRIAQVCTPTSAFLPYSWAQTIFWRNERWIERSKRVLPPPSRSIFLPCRNLHILCIVFDLHPPPKGHIISHISIAHNGGEKGLWRFHVLSAGCRCARGSISYHERSCLALNIYNHFASLPLWSNKVAKQRLIYSAGMDFCRSINASSRHLGPLSGVRSTAVI